MLVFVYGRNLSPDVFAEPCPEAVPWGRALLSGHRLADELSPNIVRDARGRVWGALYEIEDRQLQDLDSFEAGRGYRRLEVDVIVDEFEIRAWAYRNENPCPGPLDPSCLEPMIEGALLNEIPETYLSELEKRAFASAEIGSEEDQLER